MNHKIQMNGDAVLVPPPAHSGDAPMIRPLTTATLNHLLAYELMAATACRAASLRSDLMPIANVLRQVIDGHQRRAVVIHEAILANQGHPAADPKKPDALDLTPLPDEVPMALAQLLHLEQRGVADYRQALRQMDDRTRTVVEADLLPDQERALATLAGLQPPSPDGAV